MVSTEFSSGHPLDWDGTQFIVIPGGDRVPQEGSASAFLEAVNGFAGELQLRSLLPSDIF